MASQQNLGVERELRWESRNPSGSKDFQPDMKMDVRRVTDSRRVML
jgi:hypothetical protein